MQSVESVGIPSSLLKDVLPFLGGILAALLAYFAARRSTTAPLQEALNDAFRTMMDKLQTERVQNIARISELEGEVLRQRGEIAQHIQIAQSLQHQIDRYRTRLDRYE